MKILALQGSPLVHGNTAMLLDEFAKGALDAGAEVEIIALQECRIEPCDMCDKCDCGAKDFCVHNDDMRSIMSKAKSADAIVLATSVWWTGASTKTKMFLDRLYGYRSTEYFSGKKIYLLTSFFNGHYKDKPIPGTDIIAHVVQSIADFGGMEFLGHFRASHEGPITDEPGLLTKAYKEGKNFAKVMLEAK